MLSGKQRELAERDELFLAHTWAILTSEGYQALTIERVAKETGFSKGTLYLRFGSKDGLVVALGIEARTILHEILSRASTLQGRPRERMAAMGEASRFYAQNFAHHLRVIKLIEAEMLLARVSESEGEAMARHDLAIFELLVGIVREGVSAGDLSFGPGESAEALVFSLWALTDGTFGALNGGAPLARVGISDPFAEVIVSASRLLDGYGWRPLSGEWDYAATLERARTWISGAADIERYRRDGRGLWWPDSGLNETPAAAAVPVEATEERRTRV